MNRTIIGAIVAISAAAPLWAVGQEEAAGAGAAAADFTPVSIVDTLGRTVTIDKPVERIAYTHFGTAEALMILDAWDMVVARDGYPKDPAVFPNQDSIPTLSGPMDNPYQPNLELLLSVEADLLLMEPIPMPGMHELIAELEGLIPVAVFKLYENDSLDRDLLALGRLLNREAQATEYLQWYNEVTETLIAATGTIPLHERVTTFLKTGYGDVDNLMTFSDELEFIAYRNDITGSVNVAADLPSYGGWVQTIDPEWLISQQIDVLFVADPLPGAYGAAVTDAAAVLNHRKAVMDHAVFVDSAAVANGRVFALSEELFGTPRFIVGLSYMAKWCHPERLSDFDPRAIHQEYLTRFMGATVDLAQQGVFVYPEG